MAPWVLIWCVPPVLVGVGLFLAARPVATLGGPWRHLRSFIVAASAITVAGPWLAWVALTRAMSVAIDVPAEERASALAMAVSEGLNLGAFVFLIGGVLQVLTLGLCIRGRKKARLASSD